MGNSRFYVRLLHQVPDGIDNFFNIRQFFHEFKEEKILRRKKDVKLFSERGGVKT